MTPQQIVDLLAQADARPPGDVERGRIQRQIARAVHAAPSLLDDPSLSLDRTRLGMWARFAPHLLDDAREVEISRTHAPEVSRLVSQVLSLDDVPLTSHRAGDDLAAGLDDPDAQVRVAADEAARSVARRRAAVTAPALVRLAHLQAADDAERGLAIWRTRSALIEGTTPERLARLVTAVSGATPSVQSWLRSRQARCGAAYSDRRVIPEAPPRRLEADTALACAVLSEVSPSLAAVIESVPARVTHGQISECLVDDGRLTVTVAHRGTLRSTLMTAHEIGHAVHAVASAGRQPPGTLVGEAIACLATVLVAGELEADADPAAALACGDHLIDEIHLSAAASLFEDAVHDAGAGDLSASDLDALWLEVIRGVYEPAVSVPDVVGTDWARHPTFVASPGHAVSYVWANLFALTVADRAMPDLGDRMAEAMGRGALDADEFLEIFDVTPDHLADVGLAAFAVRLERLARIAFA